MINVEIQRTGPRSDITQVPFINVREKIDYPLEIGVFRAKALDTSIIETGRTPLPQSRAKPSVCSVTLPSCSTSRNQGPSNGNPSIRAEKSSWEVKSQTFSFNLWKPVVESQSFSLDFLQQKEIKLLQEENMLWFSFPRKTQFALSYYVWLRSELTLLPVCLLLNVLNKPLNNGK